MALLAEFAITPDVFDVTSYSSEELCGLHLERLREVMLTEGLVRDLRAGEWCRLFMDSGRPWHRRGKELVKKLATQGRLVRYAPFLDACGTDEDPAWCAEAVGTHEANPFTGGVIVTGAVKEAFPDEHLVAAVHELAKAPWWVARSGSVRPVRNIEEYRSHLGVVLRCANSLMFIDPHLDPARHGYKDFARLIEDAGGRIPAPAIEIHRVCYEGSGPGRTFPMNEETKYFERLFSASLGDSVRRMGLSVAVFVWDDFHDRYLISDLVGVSVPNGFDTTTSPNSVTTWTRLGRDARDDLQREFDPASGRHALKSRFVIE